MKLSYYARPLVAVLALLAAGIFLRVTFFPSAPAPGSVDFIASSAPAYGEGRVSVSGRACSYPYPCGEKTCVEICSVSVDGKAVSGSVLAEADKAEGVTWRSPVRAEGRLGPVYAPRTPGGFNRALHMWSLGVGAEMETASIIPSGGAPWPFGTAGGLRDRALEALRANLSPAEYAVASGILLGRKEELDSELRGMLVGSGAMHLLVASGSNVAFPAALAYFLCGLIGLRRRWAAWFALALSGAYVVLAGCDPPLVRAYIMMAFAAVAWLADRDSGPFAGLCLAAFAILVFSPRSLMRPDFQLSFLAAYAIITAFAAFELPEDWGSKTARAAIYIVLANVAVELWLLPLSVAYFHRVSLIGPVANLALIPLSACIMAAGAVSCAAAFAGGWAVWLASWPLKLLCAAFLWGVKLFSAVPLASVNVPSFGYGAAAAFLALLFAVVHFRLTGRRKELLTVCAATAVVAATTGYLFSDKQPWAAFFADSKSAAVLCRKDGGLILLGAGPDRRRLVNAVLWAGSRRVEAVALDSLREEEWRGLAELAGEISIGALYVPYGPVDWRLAETMRRLSGGGTRVVRFWPGEDFSAAGIRVTPQWAAFPLRGKETYAEYGYTGRPELDYTGFKVDFGTGFVTVSGNLWTARAGQYGGPGQFDIISRRENPQKVSFSVKGVHAGQI